jgi:hypothetical protein
MKSFRTTGIAVALLAAWVIAAPAQTWTKLKTQPSFQTDTALLLPNGKVMVHEYNSPNWYELTPDNTGSYLNGTWSQLGSMPSNYKPLYFASQVLPDGNVLVEGGEYNNLSQDETNLGAYYNSRTNKWVAVNPPSGWNEIGDSPSVILPSGQFFIGRNESEESALFVEKTLSWTAVGSGKLDDFEEEGFALLPDGTVLTVDSTGSTDPAEKYIPSEEKWVSASTTGVRLYDPGSEEIGPEFLLPNGTVFATGANASGGGNTSVYTPPSNPTDPGSWTPGPVIPNNDDMADAPGAVLPDGNVLISTSPGIFNDPITMYEYDGTGFTKVPAPASAPQTTSYQGRMLVLPTGQVLYNVADGEHIDTEIYTPSGSPNPAWAPTITSVPTTITRGKPYVIKGTQFNGVASGAMYGDDAQMNTNYPIIRITNQSTGHVFYGEAGYPSTSAVGTGSAIVSTHFEILSSTETGASTLEVVTNGIASDPVNVTIQ